MRMDSDVWAGRWGVDGEGRGGNDGTVDWKYLKYSTLRYIIVRYLYTIHLYTLTLIHLYKYSFMNSVIKSTVQGLITFIPRTVPVPIAEQAELIKSLRKIAAPIW